MSEKKTNDVQQAELHNSAQKNILQSKLPKHVSSKIEQLVREGLLSDLIVNQPLTKTIQKPALNLLPIVNSVPKLLSSYPKQLNPFLSASTRIKLDQYEYNKLNQYFQKVTTAKNVDELINIVDHALASGIRINAINEKGLSFSDVTILKMCKDKFKKDVKEKIIRKLALSGADFDEYNDKEAKEICEKVQKEVAPQIYDQLKKLREVGKNAAIKGTVVNVEIDNKTFYMEFSEDSRVDVAKVLYGTRNLGLSKGDVKLGNNIIKIKDGGIEVRTEENGQRNYLNISDNSAFVLIFPTTFGELHLSISHSMENYDQVQVKVKNQEIWDKLQKTGEVVGSECLLGGISIKEAIIKGGFLRPGKWCSNEIIKKAEVSETLS